MIPIGGVITTITFKNETSSAMVNEPVTFGQAFISGDLPSGNAWVELQGYETTIPCQLDVKTTHEGSVRHASISAILALIPANTTLTYNIVRALPAISAEPKTPADFPGLNAVAIINSTGTELAGPLAGVTYTADAANKLASGDYITLLSGAIVSEWLLRVPLVDSFGNEHPDLCARFYIRAYAGQARARINYFIENCWAKEKAVPSGNTPWELVSTLPQVYGFTLKAGAQTVHTREKNGYARTTLSFNGNGVYDGNATGLANDATVYTATITVDGVAKPISMTGSSAQTFGQLKALFNSQLGGTAICANAPGMAGLLFTSVTTGVNSSVYIDYGTLFPALLHINPFRPMRGDEYIHYPFTRWKKTFWWGTPSTVHIVPNKVHLIETNASPNYPPNLTGSLTTIAANLASIQASDIGGNGLTKAYMGDVGYAAGIGLLPEWTAMYLINQGADAKHIMLKQADLLGSWPVHVRDYNTDLPLSFEDWPYAALIGNVSDSYNPATQLNERIPSSVQPTSLPANANRPDSSHHPDFCFIPYLITADHDYLEGMIFYQRYLGLNVNPASIYRMARKCLWKPDQPRGQAWSLRTTVHTLYLIPDDHPLKADIAYTLAENLAWYNTNYVAPTGMYHNALGFIYHGYGLAYSTSGGANTGLAPWMDDFFTTACGRAVELGFEEVLPLLTFKSRSVAGRLTSGAEYCWQLATSYALRVKTSSGATVLYSTWGEVYQTSHSTAILAAQCGSQAMATALSAALNYVVTQNSMSGYPTQIAGYPSNLQSAVAYCATFDMPGGKDAWEVFDARASKPDYNLGPQFSLVPKELGVVTVSAPPDNYQISSGQIMYIGMLAAVVAQGFDSISFINTSDGAPWAAQNGKIMVVSLHGSSGSSSNGRQYTANVSGFMSLPDHTVFTFGLTATWNGVFYTVELRPVDKWVSGGANRESMHIGFETSDGKVHLTSERRYDAMLDYADKELTIYDLKKRVLKGGSMGGWGTITYGMRRVSKFAALYPDRPRWRYGYSVGNISVATFGGFKNVSIANSPMLADEDGGGSYAAYIDAIAYVSNTANKIPWIGWCCGRNDGFATFQDQIDAVVALRSAKRGFAFVWNNGDHSTGSIMAQILQSYQYGTFEIGKGYPLFTDHSGDQNPEVDLVGGINAGLSFRNVVETPSGWSCEVTSVLGARTVQVEPISDVFTTAVAKQLVTIPAANNWVPVSFSV